MADVKILLVEDESLEAMDIKQLLESFGYGVPFVASSIGEALKKALEIMPDLILIDKVLNKENINIDTVADIKKFNIPLIYLTDNLEGVNFIKDFNTKQVNYLIKPHDPLELKYFIETIISKKMIEKEFNYYKTIFEHIGTASAIIEEDATISLVNSEFENLSGYSRDELEGKKWTDIVSQEDIEKMREYHYLHRTNSKSVPSGRDFRLITREGSVKYIHLDIGLIPGTKKSVATLLDISDFRDVTESRRSQDALIESENKYSTLFNNASDGIFLLKDDRFIDCNKKVLESYGVTKDQIIGKTPYLFSPKLQPDGKKSKDKSIEFINQALNGHPQHFEWKHERYDGTPFIVEVTLNRIKIRDEYLIQAMVRDITDRKKSEEKIDKLSRLYATLSQINQAVVRIKNKDDLFKTICEVCVEYGKFEMAWIGIIDKETGNIVPVEHYGYENGYLEKIQLNITDSPSLKKPSITAIKKGKISISDNLKNDLNRQFSYEAINRNYQSLVSIPLKIKGEIIGILNIYSSKSSFFRGEEMDLIKEMGSDISFALDTIETKKEKKLIEKSLSESERNYRELVDNSLVGVYKTNLNGDILFANDSMAHIFQYDNVEELKKENMKDLYKIKDDRIKFIDKLEKDGQVTDYELKIIGNYGELVNTIISASLADDIISGMLMDITDLKQSEEKFKALINNSSDLIRILDKNGLITFDSPSSKRILGYPEEYFIGKNPLDYIHPDDLERVKKDLDEVFENNNPGTPTEFRIRKADGTYIYVESVSQNMFKIPYINGIVVTTHPIQQRKEMEDKILENEKKYRTLFEEDPDYTILLKPDGTILDANNATTEIAGLSQKDLIGENFTELKIIPPEDLKLHLDRISSLLKGEDIEPFESRFIDKYGDIHWVLVRFKAVKENKDVNYILGIATDITDYKIAANEIKSSLREKNILIQEIHHRVKNNMQIISSLLNLQKQYVDEKEAVNVLMESQNRVKSMSLIHEKLYLSKDFTHINFAEYIESLVMNLFYTYNVKDNIIKPILEIDDVNLNMETAVPCGLIISETVSNSLKYAFPNEMTGEIYISLKSVEDKYELIIRDNGIGLPDELDFNNLDSLGLLLVYNLTDQIDGDLKINNNPGTEFKITFKELEYKKRI